MWSRVPKFAVLSIVVLAVIPAVAQDVAPSDLDVTVLTVGVSEELRTRNLLPAIAVGDPHTMAVVARVYDTPVQRNATTGAIVPRLAVGIDQDGDAQLDPGEFGSFPAPTTAGPVTVLYRFQDVHPATFHDGAPVTAMDLLFSYHLFAMNPYAKGPLRVLMDQGGAPGSNHSVDRWLWVREVDDGDGNASTAALRYTLQFPYPNFVWATLGIPVMPRHIWEGTGGGRHADFGLAVYPEVDARAGLGIPTWELGYPTFDYPAAESWDVQDADLVGSGHFAFDTWLPGVETRLVSNPWYAFGAPQIAGIRFKVYRPTLLGVFALQSGEVDMLLSRVGTEFWPDLNGTTDVATVLRDDLHPDTLYANLREAPWGYSAYPPPNRTVDAGHVLRKAIDMAVDRSTIVGSLLQGFGYEASGFVSPANGNWHNGSLVVSPYDLSAASAILDTPEAQGVGIGPDPPGTCAKATPAGCRSLGAQGTTPFEILTVQADFDPVQASEGALVAQALRDIGLNVESRPMAVGEISNRAAMRDFDFYLGGWIVHGHDPWTLQGGDPDYLLDAFHSSNSAARNDAGFWDAPPDSPSFDEVAESVRSTDAVPAREDKVHDAEGILATRLPAIPLAYRQTIEAYRTDTFKGWKVVGTTLFNYWSLQGLVPPPVPNPPPEITLRSPADGALIPAGVTIDIEVSDTDLTSVTVQVDGGNAQALPPPYDLDTTGWTDGPHGIRVDAEDASGNGAMASYSFTLDSTPPSIELLSPPNGAIVAANAVLDIAVTDAHPALAWIEVDGGAAELFESPFDFSVAGLPDGTHAVKITARDSAGNVALEQFEVTVDTTPPEIELRSPANGSLLPRDAGITLDIRDAHLATSTIRVDSGPEEPILSGESLTLLELNAAQGFGGGTHDLTVEAVDVAGNLATARYTFTWDPTPPAVVSRSPAGTVTSASRVEITFSEPMNRTSVAEAFMIVSEDVAWTADEGTVSWTEDGMTFLFHPNVPLQPGRMYTIRLAASASDVAGNGLGAPIAWTVTVGAPSSFAIVATVLLMILAAAAVATYLFVRRKRKTEDRPPEGPRT